MLVPRARQVIGREPHLPQRRPRRGHFEALLLLKCLEEVTERDRRTIAIYSRLYGATYRDRTLAVVALAHRVVLPGPSTRMVAELRILLIHHPPVVYRRVRFSSFLLCGGWWVAVGCLQIALESRRRCAAAPAQLHRRRW